MKLTKKSRRRTKERINIKFKKKLKTSLNHQTRMDEGLSRTKVRKKLIKKGAVLQLRKDEKLC